MTTMFTKCRMESCSRKVVPGSYYCAHPDCVRLREALAKRTAPPGKRETGPIVSRDEETAKAASKPTQSEVLAAVQATQASTLPRAPEPLDLGDLDDEEDEEEPEQTGPRLRGPKPGNARTGPRRMEGRYWSAVLEVERKLLEDCVAAGNRRVDHAAAWLGLSKLGLKGLIKRTGFDATRLKMSDAEKAARLQAHMEARTLRRLIAKTTSPKAKQALEEALKALEAA